MRDSAISFDKAAIELNDRTRAIEGLNLMDYNPDMSKTGDLARPAPLKTPSATGEPLSSELFSQMSPAP